MSGVFQFLGVDYVQWQAVTRMLLRTDFRLPMSTGVTRLGKIGGLPTLAIVLGMFGVGAAVVVVMNSDVLLTGTIALTYLSVMVVTTVMAQHGITLLSTVDYVILGSRPVSSRTFLAIRVTNVLFHTLLITTLMAYPVVIAYAFAHGADGVRAIAAAVAIYLWVIAVTLTLIASYGALLHIVGAARFHRALGYLQMVGGFLAYGGFLLMTRLFERPSAIGTRMPDSAWLLLAPPAWFASYIEIAVGTSNSTTLIRALMSVALVLALVITVQGKLGLEYASRLGDLHAAGQSAAAAVVRTPFFTNGEARAVAILVVAHFRHDLRVRMGVLAVVPAVLFYLLLGAHEGAFDMVAMAVLLFPAVLSQHFASTDAYRASWIYSVTPADRGRLVLSLKNVAAVYFLVPFLLFVLVVFSWRMGTIGHALVHTTILGLLSHIALQGSAVISPRLPFAMPPDKIRGNATLFVWLTLILIGGQLAVAALDRWIYVSSIRTLGTIAGLAALSALLDRLPAWRTPAIPS